MHLVKLCVGVSEIEELEHWRSQVISEQRAKGERLLVPHVTRMFPTRGDELLNGGSLYWVIKGVIQCRSKIISLDRVIGSDGIKRCAIMMDPEVIKTARTPKRPFQGWRYLKPEDAPRDLSDPDGGGDELPEEMRAQLMEMGAW